MLMFFLHLYIETKRVKESKTNLQIHVQITRGLLFCYITLDKMRQPIYLANHLSVNQKSEWQWHQEVYITQMNKIPIRYNATVI